MRNDKMKFTEVLISVWFWFSLFFFSGLIFPVALVIWVVTVLFDRRRYILHQFTCRWSDVTLFLNPYWKLTVKGREKVDPKKVYVMVSNHQSGLDILVLFKLHKHFKWVANRSFSPFLSSAGTWR
jgi:1-acyl-sn-glycerol-3-phosphate acyltransferase